MTRATLFFFLLLGAAGATLQCQGAVDLDSRPCPCADGYVCCEATQACLANGEKCPVLDGGGDAGAVDARADAGVVTSGDWCATHATSASLFCDDFDQSLKAPTPGSFNACSGQVINGVSSGLVLTNSEPNLLAVTCNPNTLPAAVDYIFYGYKTYYPAPNGITLNFDIYVTPYDNTDTLVSLFRVGLADGSWWMEYDYSGTTAVIQEFTSTNPLVGQQTPGPSYPVPQMNMSMIPGTPGWYNVAFSVDFVRNVAWLNFNIEPSETPSGEPAGTATRYLNSFPITTFAGTTAAAWDFAFAEANPNVGTANSYIEVRWGLNTGNSTFQQQSGANLTLDYDNVDFEAVPAGGISDAGPVFPPR